MAIPYPVSLPYIWATGPGENRTTPPGAVQATGFLDLADVRADYLNDVLNVNSGQWVSYLAQFSPFSGVIDAQQFRIWNPWPSTEAGAEQQGIILPATGVAGVGIDIAAGTGVGPMYIRLENDPWAVTIGQFGIQDLLVVDTEIVELLQGSITRKNPTTGLFSALPTAAPDRLEGFWEADWQLNDWRIVSGNPADTVRWYIDANSEVRWDFDRTTGGGSRDIYCTLRMPRFTWQDNSVPGNPIVARIDSVTIAWAASGTQPATGDRIRLVVSDRPNGTATTIYEEDGNGSPTVNLLPWDLRSFETLTMVYEAQRNNDSDGPALTRCGVAMFKYCQEMT